MSDSQEVTERALHRLSTQLTCPVCQDTYQDPKVLPCLHVFCAACLEGHISQDGTSLTCPKCQNLKWLPQGGVQSLQSPFCIQHLFNVQDTLEKVTDKTLSCQHCGENKALKYCSNCSEFYCEMCTEAHKEWTGFMGHKVDAVETVEAEAVSLVPIKKVEFNCTKHPGKSPQLYCETCEELICECCLVKVHRSCTYSLVEDCFPKHRDAITASLQPVKQQLDTVNQAIGEMDARSQSLAEQSVSTKQKITDQIDQLHEILETRKQELVAQVDRLAGQSQEAIKVQREGYEQLQTQLSSSIDYVNESLRTGTEEEILSIKKQVVDHLGQMKRDFDVQMVQPEPEQTLRFDHQKLADTCEKFGKVFLISSISPHENSEDVAQTENAPATVIAGSPPHTPVAFCIQFKGKHVKSISGFREPRQMAIRDNGEIILVEKQGDCVTVLDRDGHKFQYFGLVAGTGTGTVSCPRGVTLCGNDSVLVAAQHCVRKFTMQGELIASVGMEGRGRLQFCAPWALTFNPSNNKVYVCDTGNHRIQILNGDLTFFGEFGSRGTGQGQFKSPTSIAVNSKGNVFVADFFNNRIQVFDQMGEFVREVKQRGPGMGRLKSPVSLCIDANDTLYVFESNEYCVSVFNSQGQFTMSFGRRGNRPGEFICPYGMAVDTAGKLYISDTHHHNIQIFK